jgi:hypothetical protein
MEREGSLTCASVTSLILSQLNPAHTLASFNIKV